MMIRTIDGQALGEEVQIARLESGAQIAVAAKPGFSTSAGYVGLRYGSTDTRFSLKDGTELHVPDGSAHFLEHKLFEGREEKVFDRFGKLGAQFNGGTGFRSTNYYFQSASNFEACLEVLLDFVQRPLITEDRVEKEKGIIEQEVRMYEDDPNYRGLFLLHRALFHQHPIRITPGGAVSEVRRTTAADLQACFDAFYVPSNLVLSLSGDFDPTEVLEKASALVGDSTPPGTKKIYPSEPRTIAHARLEDTFSVTRPHVWLGCRDEVGVGLGEPLLRRRIESSLVLDLALDWSTKRHEDLYEKGILDDTFSMYYSCDEDWSYAVLSGQTENPEQFLEGVRMALADFVQVGPQAEDVERVRRAAWGSVVSGIQTPSALASSVLSSLLLNQEPFGALAVLESIQLGDLHQRAKELLNPARFSEALILPS